jgi:hypothetical protein
MDRAWDARKLNESSGKQHQNTANGVILVTRIGDYIREKLPKIPAGIF